MRIVALAVRRSDPEQPGRDPTPPQAVAADGTVPTVLRIGGGRGWVRRAVLTALAAFSALVVGMAVLLLAAPSPGDARSLARAQARSPGAALPGPPVPPRLATAFISTADHTV